MTNVEVDFFFVDKDDEVYYIDTDIIPYIEGDGNSSIAMVDWRADMLAQKIKVVADVDGSDGGPAEAYQDITINPAEYAQKLHCPYPTGSGYRDDELEYYIKITNIGSEEDDVLLEVKNAGSWTVEFDNGADSKTIHDIASEDYSWQLVRVTIPSTAGGDDYLEFNIKSTSQGDTNKVKSIMLKTTVLRSTKPILMLDRDFNRRADGTKYWEAALNDAGYEGMYTTTTGAITNANNYDVILMCTGFVGPSANGLTQQDETRLINFLKGGGSLWIGGARFIQVSNEPQFGRTNNHELFYKYMNVTWAAHDRRIALGGTLNGVPGDPIGQGKSYGQNLVYNEGHSHLESIWFEANDTSSHGTFLYGEDQYFGTRHHWTGETEERPFEYRTAYTGIDLAQVGDTYGINEKGTLGHPDRADVLYNHATWLGVSPPLPDVKDLGIYKIIDPAGKYIYPGDTIDINVEVANYGIKDFERSFDLEVEIEQINGPYSKTLTKEVDVSDNPIPAKGWAYPGMITVSLPWTIPNQEDAKYKITAILGDDDNNDNNENFTYGKAKKVLDVQTIGSIYTYRVFMIFAALKNTPMRIDVEVENIGSRSATFDVFVDIIEPYESGSLEYMTKEITLGPGHSRIVPFIWTADKAAGVKPGTGMNRAYTSDGPPYWMDVGIDLEDDDTDNNVVIHDPGSRLGDIFVGDFIENAEMGNHGWTVEEPWHPSVVWDKDPLHSWYCGNASSVKDGFPLYDNGVDAAMYSPIFDWTDYVAVRYDNIKRYQFEDDVDYAALQIKMLDEDDIWRDVGNVNYSDSNPQRLKVTSRNPQNLANYAGHIVQMRWIFHSDDQNAYRGISVDAMIIMANADNYFDRDLVLDSIQVNPLVGDVEQARQIKVTVKNIGEVVPEEGFTVWANVTNGDGEKQEVSIDGNKRNSESIPQDDDFTKGATKTVTWDWDPSVYGIYNIECSIEWDEEEFPGNNQLITVGLVQYYFFFDDMEEGNPKEPEYDPWITGTEDTNNKGGNLATDDWEEGVPTVGPQLAYSGTKCWATSLGDYYSNNSKDSSFLTVRVDLKTAKEPYLLFAHWLEIEAQGYDSAYVEIRETGETKWTVIWKNPEPERAIYSSVGWEMVNISLEDWQLKDIQLRFRLMSDSDVSLPGWYIDDVGISGSPPPEYDAKLDYIEVTPFYGGNIPPGESILIEAQLTNIGLKDSGGSHRITVTGQVFRVTGETTENKIKDLDDQEIQVNSGQKAMVQFTYALPGGNNVKYRIEIKVNYVGESDRDHVKNNIKSVIILGKMLHDAAIENLYVTPPLEDAGYPRVVTAVVRSHSNIPEGDSNDFYIDFSIRYPGTSEVIDSGSVPVRLEVGETKEIHWNWTAYTYGFYEVTAEVDLEDDVNNDPGHENIQVIEVATVEKIFTDTVDNPVVSGGEMFETYWTGLQENSNVAGWHKVDRGHLSREGYYVGKTSSWSYSGSMAAEFISEPIDLTGVTGAALRWYTLFHVEGGVYDNLVLYFSDNNGDDWIEQTRYPKYDYRNSSQYTQNNGGWLMKEQLLYDNFYTDEFRIKFKFVSDRAINYLGVFIDDISIYVTGSEENHAPVARFTASCMDEDTIKETAYSMDLIERPLHGFQSIRNNPAFNNLPLPEGGKQGGIGFNAADGLSDPIQFDGRYSYDPDRDQEDISYLWDFGDGTSGNSALVTHRYSAIPKEKYYDVTLTVKDELDSSILSEDTLRVWLGNNAPIVSFIVTDSFDTFHILNDEYGAEVFYGDTLKLISDVQDPENDHIISYEWSFGEKGKEPDTHSSSEFVDFTVGKDHLYRDEEGGVPIMPPYNSNPVEYVVSLKAVDDNFNEGSFSLNVTVYPYAFAEFVAQIQQGTTLLDTTVDLVWRGLPEEAAPGKDYITSKPVFVYIEETDSPDPNLASRGGCGGTYDIRVVWTKLQNGEDGFITAEISLPVLSSQLESYGDPYSLQDDLRLEYYDNVEKRFIAVENSHVEPDLGVRYVVGEVDHFSIYSAIVDTIYINDPSVQPDLEVTKVEFSRSPAQHGQEVEIRAYVRNNGKISARNVDVKIYDGDDLVGDTRIDIIMANGNEVMISEKFTATMFDINQGSENHQINVMVNKQRAINEGAQNYKNNEKQEILVVTSIMETSPSFESTSFMMVISVTMVILASATIMRKPQRRKKDR